jgi:predicted HTH domain antitoxin
MTLNINIPDDAERALRQAWGDGLDRAALEALAVEGYRSGKLSAAEVGRLIGITDRWLVNKWLADRRVPLNYTMEDFEADRRTLDQFFGKSA